MTQELSYCGRLVKDNDPDRFLLSMLMPAECREALWALFAFNHEIAKTREVVSETTLGQIRLQWWRDAVSGVYGDGVQVLEHEVVGPLAAAIRAHDLPRDHFDALIYAREFDLEDVAPAHLEGLLIYADHTTTPLMKLAVQITGGDPDIEAVQPVAINYALVGLLRAVPFHASQGRCFLPQDLMAAQGIRIDRLGGRAGGESGLPHSAALCKIIEEVVEEMVWGQRAESQFLILSNHLAMIYLKQLKRLKYDVFSPKMAISPAFKELRMLAYGLLS